ncbi:MAG: RusA family crossover junction endodeoxyribonuclease [Anaerolineaceae bacterium]|nr:RusA family crossover junction endodeoxyribonuclease [Anaerolineaceae bacterium]
MPIFDKPIGLEEVARFSIPRVQTWGSSHDQEYQQTVRERAGLSNELASQYAWFVFSIHCIVNKSRGQVVRQIPDVENIPKLIVDAFTGLLYPDDHIHHVRGVQVEAEFGPDGLECAEVWIYGKRK